MSLANYTKKCKTGEAEKKKMFYQERYNAINEEMEKLLGARFIREIEYPKWISNVVMVKKRMCLAR